jgi:tetratricopeptide (TPR) repeat protein
MKKVLIALLLMMAVAAVAQDAGQAGAAPAGQAQPSQKKEIKDPAEYNSYVGAIQMTDPQQKIAALEDFLTRYPNSVVKEDALEQVTGAYQQTGNLAKTVDSANKLLQANPNNLVGLALMAAIDRQDQSAQAAQKVAEAGQLGQRGLQALQTAPKPDGVSDADWAKRKEAFATVFHSAVGVAALNQKNYPVAVENLSESVKANPTNLQDVYPLALAYLSQQPVNPLGLFYAARAATLAQQMAAQNPAYAGAAKQMGDYGRRSYVRYHGGDDGWQEVLTAAQQNPLPPANFAVAPAPTPKEMADKLVATKSVNQMSPDELELVLTSGNQVAADRVWAGLKGVPQQFVGQVVEVTSKTELMVAFTYDAIQANRADIDLTMAGPVPASMTPKVGQQIKLVGTPISYTVTPGQANQPATLLIKMDKGAFLEEAKPKAKPPVHHRPR